MIMQQAKNLVGAKSQHGNSCVLCRTVPRLRKPGQVLAHQPTKLTSHKLHKWLRLQVTCNAASSNGSAASDDSHAGHAFLHDFCMTLPYGAGMMAAGVACFFLGPLLKALALPTLSVGAASLGLAVLSLGNWRKAKASTVFTLASAGASGGAAYLAFPAITTGLTAWVAGAITVASAAACVFCLYNVVAGGNPPKKGTH